MDEQESVVLLDFTEPKNIDATTRGILAMFSQENNKLNIPYDTQNLIAQAIAVTASEKPDEQDNFELFGQAYKTIIDVIYGKIVTLNQNDIAASRFIIAVAERLRQSVMKEQPTPNGKTLSMIGDETWDGKLEVFCRENKARLQFIEEYVNKGH